MHVWHLLELPIEATFSLTGDIPTTIRFIPIYKNSSTQPIILLAYMRTTHTHTHKYVSFHSGLEVWHELSKQHWWPWSYWSSISSQWFSWHAIFIQSVIWIHAAQRCQCHTCSYLSTILLFLHMAYNMIRWRWSSSWYSLLNLGGSDMNCSLN